MKSQDLQFRQEIDKGIEEYGFEAVKTAIENIGLYSVSLLEGKVLKEGDTFMFGPKGAWEGPVFEDGCVVYKVIEGNHGGGIVYVKHADGSVQRHPGKNHAFPIGSKVYLCKGILHFPEPKEFE